MSIFFIGTPQKVYPRFMLFPVSVYCTGTQVLYAGLAGFLFGVYTVLFFFCIIIVSEIALQNRTAAFGPGATTSSAHYHQNNSRVQLNFKKKSEKINPCVNGQL